MAIAIVMPNIIYWKEISYIRSKISNILGEKITDKKKNHRPVIEL